MTLEWEAIRHRGMRDTLIRAKARDLAIGALDKGEIKESFFPGVAARQLGAAVFDADRGSAAEGAAALEARNISVHEIAAVAYGRVAHKVAIHERKLTEIEIRRRRLKPRAEATGPAARAMRRASPTFPALPGSCIERSVP